MVSEYVVTHNCSPGGSSDRLHQSNHQMTAAEWATLRPALAKQLCPRCLSRRGARAVAQAETIVRHTDTRRRCMRCGEPATMNASMGPACANCYDRIESEE